MAEVHKRQVFTLRALFGVLTVLCCAAAILPLLPLKCVEVLLMLLTSLAGFHITTRQCRTDGIFFARGLAGFALGGGVGGALATMAMKAARDSRMPTANPVRGIETSLELSFLAGMFLSAAVGLFAVGAGLFMGSPRAPRDEHGRVRWEIDRLPPFNLKRARRVTIVTAAAAAVITIAFQITGSVSR